MHPLLYFRLLNKRQYLYCSLDAIASDSGFAFVLWHFLLVPPLLQVFITGQHSCQKSSVHHGMPSWMHEDHWTQRKLPHHRTRV